LKGREEKKEAHIYGKMCEGVCDKCREKVQWRFQYNRYKSLTKPGGCRNCKNKTVTKAYRIFCDPCATSKAACAACGGNTVQLNNERRAELLVRGLIKENSDDEDEDEEEDEEEDEVGNEKVAAGEGEEDEDEEGEEDDDEVQAAAASIAETLEIDSVFQITDKDVRKMDSYGAAKYSKNRTVGTEEDAAYVQDLKRY
jgi:hypothetical protein